MRSTLNIRLCHLLRVMRLVAPVEWSLGLPFPSHASIADGGAAIDQPEEINIASWFDSRTKAVAGNRIERSLAA